MGGERLRLTLFFLGVWASSNSFALLGLGSITVDSKRYQKNSQADRRYFQYAPFMSFHYKWQLSERHEFIPELGMAWHPSSSPNHGRMSMFLIYAMSSRLWSSHRVHYGFGNLMTRIYGQGGQVLMNNGNTADAFFKPSGSSVSHTSVAFLGYEYRLEDFLGIRINFLTRPIFSKQRSFGLMLSTNVYYF